jgi:hypothetical protein
MKTDTDNSYHKQMHSIAFIHLITKYSTIINKALKKTTEHVM